MVKEHPSASSKPWVTLFAFSLCTVAPLATGGQPNLLGAAPAVMAVFEDVFLAPFNQLRIGMRAHEVIAAMKHRPHRQAISNHLGVEVQRLVWIHFGSTYEVVLVAGLLVSKSTSSKPLIG